MTSEPLVIVAAVNGGMQMDRDGAHVPISPEEIAEDARLCAEAGAAIVHLHARDESGRNSADPEVYNEIIRRIRERSDILVQTTNGIGVRPDPETGEIGWPSDAERLALLNLEQTPDLYGIAAGSTDFLHPEGGYHIETVYAELAAFSQGNDQLPSTPRDQRLNMRWSTRMFCIDCLEVRGRRHLRP